MGIHIEKLSYMDLEFYKEYYDWYYHEWYPKNTPVSEVTHDLKIGDVVKINHSVIESGYENQNGIVMGYTGINNYCYVIAYCTRSRRYWACGFYESELNKLDKSIYDDERLYSAFETWIIRNTFRLCSEDFQTKYYDFTRNQNSKNKSILKNNNIIYVNFASIVR